MSLLCFGKVSIVLGFPQDGGSNPQREIGLSLQHWQSHRSRRNLDASWQDAEQEKVGISTSLSFSVVLRQRYDKRTKEDIKRKETRQDKTKQGKTMQDDTRQDKARQDKARQDQTTQDKIKKKIR